MPIYEYRCDQCGALNEVLLLGKEEAPSCSACGSKALTKLMSASNFSIKGGSPSFAAPPQGCCGSADMCGGADSCASRGQCCSE